VNRAHPSARAARPGIAVPGVLALLAALLMTLFSACGGGREPEIPTGRRSWDGPGDYVASSGITTYERREIAQKVPFPRCLEVQSDRYRFEQVEVLPVSAGGVPPGLFDTGFHLDRWRLWSPPGPVPGQATLYLTVLGSSGIMAVYERAPDCPEG
jgi:hypothetical protein